MPIFLKKVDTLVGSMLTRIIPRPFGAGSPPSAVRRVLLIRPGGIGDAVLLVPTIRSLRLAYPKIDLHVLAERRNASVFQLAPEVNSVHCYDRPKELLSVLFKSYDVIIDTEQWHRLSAIVARLIRSPVKIGFATNDRNRMLTHGLAYCHDDYEGDSFLRLLTPLGVAIQKEVEDPFLQVPTAVQGRAGKYLQAVPKPFVALFPGASISERRWGAEKFQLLARSLGEKGFGVVVIGGKDDVDQGRAIVEAGGLNLAGRTSLQESAAILKNSALLVSGDSGVLHIGVGLGKPTVSLFGPGIAKKWAPRGGGHIVINKNLSCSPCTKFGYTPKCPNGARCLNDISVDEVFTAVMTLLNRTSEKAS